MTTRRIPAAVTALLVVLGSASPCRSGAVAVYDARKIEAERVRLESRARGLWRVMFDGLLTRDEQDALFAVRVHRQRDVHGRKNDCVFKRNQKKSAHVASNLIRWLSSQQAHPCQEI